jgi:hypothetical protein
MGYDLSPAARAVMLSAQIHQRQLSLTLPAGYGGSPGKHSDVFCRSAAFIF